MSRAPRIQVNMSAEMIASDGHRSAVTIIDISSAGFRIEHDDDLRSKDEIKLLLPKGDIVRAVIQWSMGKEAGALFVCPPADL